MGCEAHSVKTFKDHQIYGADMMELCGQLGIFYDMGCGKTATALLWARDAIRNGMDDGILVICPASLVRSWEEAIDGMIEFEGFTGDDVARLKTNITLTSFQKTYRRYTEEVTRKGRKVVKYRYEIREELNRRWGAIIVDESHCIGSHSSVQTDACITMASLTDRRYIMTATPVHGGKGSYDWAKLYGQIQFLENGRMWKNWTHFCKTYVTRYDRWGKPAAYRDEECEKVLKDHGIVARLEDCYDMPGYTETVIPVEPACKNMFNDIRKGILREYGLRERAAGGKFVKLRQLVSGFLKTEEGIVRYSTNKTKALEDILSSTDEPVVVFCLFTESIAICKEVCDKVGRETAVFNGKSKTASWKDLTTGKVDTLICQYQKGGPGLNLQRSAIIVFYEPCLSALLLEQSRGRIYRPGQERKCSYIYLVSDDRFESKILESVRRGVDVNNAMLMAWARNYR